MGLSEIVTALDDEILRLQQVRHLLAGANGHVTHAATSFALGTNQSKARRRRHLSTEARARISAAQKKRWAAQRKKAKKKAS
jgi:hypothetical protein